MVALRNAVAGGTFTLRTVCNGSISSGASSFSITINGGNCPKYTPGAGTTCTGVQWEFSAAPATAVTATAPAVPSMGAPTTSEVIKPDKNISLRAKGL